MLLAGRLKYIALDDDALGYNCLIRHYEFKEKDYNPAAIG
jgi:hypothetical protein